MWILAFFALFFASCDTPIEINTDDDGDGYTALEGDCDDADPTRYPGALEQCDAEDDDCDGSVDEGMGISQFRDDDSDGIGTWWDYTYACPILPGHTIIAGSWDCNDSDSMMSDYVAEVCDGKDNDCDGTADEGLDDECDLTLDSDGDGWTVGYGDCDDTRDTVNPGAAEICDNGRDDDCDTEQDENHSSCSP